MNDRAIPTLAVAVLLWILLTLNSCAKHNIVYQRRPEPNIFIKNDSVYVETEKHFVVFPYSAFSVKNKREQ